MLQCLTLESEEGAEEREESSTEDLEELKKLVALAFVRENTQKRLQNAQQHGKKKRKKKRLVLKNERYKNFMAASRVPRNKGNQRKLCRTEHFRIPLRSSAL